MRGLDRLRDSRNQISQDVMPGTQRHQDGRSIRSRTAGVRLRIPAPCARVRHAGERVMRRLAGRAAVLAVLPILILGLAAGTAAAASGVGQVQNFSCPGTDIDDPFGITAGPDGALWVTNEEGGDGAGSITEITTSGTCTNYTTTNTSDLDDPTGITAADGDLWFTNFGSNGTGTTIGWLDPAAAPADQWNSSPATGTGADQTIDGPEGITVGPDGNLWFTNTGNSNGGTIGRITTKGAVTSPPYTGTGCTVPPCIDDPTSITAAPDGEQALWFTNNQEDTIGQITTNGTVSNYRTYGGNYQIDGPFGITAAPDGAPQVWFTATGPGQGGIAAMATGQYPVGSIGASTSAGTVGTVSAFVNNNANTPEGITDGPDGANEVWFTNYGNGDGSGITIGQLDAATQAVSTYSATGTGADQTIDDPTGITVGPDGNLWFTNAGNNTVGEITVTPQTLTLTTTPPSPAVYGGSYTPKAAGGGSGNPVTFSIDPATTNIAPAGQPPAGACSINSSGVVSFKGLGTCVIDANQAGGNFYAAAAQVQQSFTIGQAPQTITFCSTPPASPLFGSIYTVCATGGGSGNPVTFGISSEGLGPCVNSGSTVTFIGAGSCIITANQAGNADYQAGYADQVITVPKETPVLTWPKPGTITIGTALTGIELDAAANVPDGTDTVAGTFTYSPPAGTVLSLGTHTLTATFTPAVPANFTSGGTVSTSITVVTPCLTCK